MPIKPAAVWDSLPADLCSRIAGELAAALHGVSHGIGTRPAVASPAPNSRLRPPVHPALGGLQPAVKVGWVHPALTPREPAPAVRVASARPRSWVA